MSASPAGTSCRRCGRAVEGEPLDAGGWCGHCRAEVVRRATRVARLGAIVLTLGFAFLLFSLFRPSPRFLIGWLVLVALVHFVLFTLIRRVAFEVIRTRSAAASEG